MSLFGKNEINQNILPFIEKGEGVGIVKVDGYGKASARMESYKLIFDSYDKKNPIIESISAISYLSYDKGNFFKEPKLEIGISHKKYILSGVDNNDEELETFYNNLLEIKNNEKIRGRQFLSNSEQDLNDVDVVDETLQTDANINSDETVDLEKEVIDNDAEEITDVNQQKESQKTPKTNDLKDTEDVEDKIKEELNEKDNVENSDNSVDKKIETLDLESDSDDDDDFEVLGEALAITDNNTKIEDNEEIVLEKEIVIEEELEDSIEGDEEKFIEKDEEIILDEEIEDSVEEEKFSEKEEVVIEDDIDDESIEKSDENTSKKVEEINETSTPEKDTDSSENDENDLEENKSVESTEKIVEDLDDEIIEEEIDLDRIINESDDKKETFVKDDKKEESIEITRDNTIEENISNTSAEDLVDDVKVTKENASEEINKMKQNLYQNMNNVQDQLISDNHNFSQFIPTVKQVDPVDQIRRYHELKEDGIITEKEFELKKKQLLNL